MMFTNQTATCSTQFAETEFSDSDRAHIEHTREIVAAASALLDGRNVCSRPLQDDLTSTDAALTSTRQRLFQTAGAENQLAAALLADTVATQAMVKDALLQRRADVALGVREALSNLRNATSTAALAERAPIEARRFGFRRALFSGIEKGVWIARTAHAADDAAFAEELVRVGKANPRRLNGPLLESEMVRRCTPVVVTDPQSNPRVHAELVRFTETTSYVAAPILAWGVPVAMVHADRAADEVDEFDRYMLGVYAEGLGLALERTQLIERLHAVRKATSDYFSSVTAIADDFTADTLESAVIGLDVSTDRVAPHVGLLADEPGERLTPREWDVLRNLASGKTNAQIATGLFVTEGTVKSHVKHILRKLGATNRTEAVARYHRLSSAAQVSKAAV
jgi:DNA-binding CsgD family transcriptional regulator